jgi:hypothetical protein
MDNIGSDYPDSMGWSGDLNMLRNLVACRNIGLLGDGGSELAPLRSANYASNGT